MAAQQHRIRRQVVEIRVPGEDAAGEIHRQFSRIQRQYLEPIVDACCSDLSSPDRLHRIEKLEVNLGSVTLQDLEADLSQSLQKALRQALGEQIQAMDRKARGRDGHPATRSQLELAAFFAMNGTLPWWADSGRPRHLPESIESLLIHAPDDLARLLADILRHPEPSLRIVLHCDDTLLLRIFDLLSSSALGSRAAREQLDTVLRGPLLSAAPSFSRARNALWIAVLIHASSAAAQPSWQPAKGAPPSPFWRRVFGALAARSPEAFEAVFAAVSPLARSADSTASRALLPVVAAIVEVGRGHGRISNAMLTEMEELLAATESSDDTAPDPAAAMDRVLDRTLEVDEDAAGEVRTTQSAERAIHRHSARQQTPDNDRTQSAPGESWPNENQPQAEPVLLPEFLDRRTSQSSESLDLRFGDADSVYIENSGLVILWPFLERFFDRLQLLHERNFIDPAARHRAAGLLQYVVTEDPSPPEYQMLLNKMLCGMGPDDLLEFGPAVTEAETQECVYLISAVIENAPVLRNMSHAGFRGSFLLRRGALSAGDATWRLRVERETFDIVLDRFPWSFSWIKLPWMEVPLAVEW